MRKLFNLTQSYLLSAIKILLLLLTTFLTGQGCFYRNYAYNDVYLSRKNSYNKWLEDYDRQAESNTVIKGKLSLQDALKLGLTNNKKLLSVMKEKDIAEGGAWESYSSFLPDVSASGKYTRLDEAASLNVGTGTIPIQTLNNYSVDLEVRQPLFSGGAILANIRSGQLGTLLSKETVRSAVQVVIYSISKDYYQVLLARHLYQTYKTAVKSAEATLDVAKKKRKQGMATKYDVLRAQVELSNFKAAMIQQQNSIQITRAGLLKEMGVSQESEVKLSDELAYVPIKTTLKDAMKLAFENRPALFHAEIELKIQEENCQIARSKFLPEVFGFFTNSWARPKPTLFGDANQWGDKWIAGIGFSLPIFNGFAREGRLMRENGVLFQKQINLKDIQEQVVLEVRQAIKNLQNAESLIESQKMNLKSATEALRSIGAGYKEGHNSPVELNDARTALTRASGLYFDSLFKHVIARLDFNRAIGVLGAKKK